MAEASFDAEGVTLRLSPSEYRFIDCAMGYVLFGIDLKDFRILMMNERSDAEALVERLDTLERQARESGSHWLWVDNGTGGQ